MLKNVPVAARFWKEFTKRAKYEGVILYKAQLTHCPGPVLPVSILEEFVSLNLLYGR